MPSSQLPAPLAAAADLLPAPVAAGLSGAELTAVERRFGFRFAADHRALLADRLPVGRGFPDWRNAEDAHLSDWLDRPVRGVLFDVDRSGFWFRDWGRRPADPVEALRVAAERMSAVPRLVPIYGHRYLPGTGGPAGHPVLSVHQTDIIVYGADLARYLRQEFGGGYRPEWVAGADCTVPFWSELVPRPRS